MKKSLKDYSNLVETPSADERDRLIEGLYSSGKEYFYTDRGKDGLYRIAWDE